MTLSDSELLKRATDADMLTVLKCWFTHQDACYRCGKESTYPHRQDSLCDEGRRMWRAAVKAMDRALAGGQG